MSLAVIFSLCVCGVCGLLSMVTPLSLGLSVGLLSGLYCLVIGVAFSSWYGYILFLIYVGGLLVMFIYVGAISPNVTFSLNKFLLSLLVLFYFVLVSFVFFKNISNASSASMSCLSDEGLLMMFSGGGFVVAKSVSLLIVLGILLLFNLVSVVKICYHSKGPLRHHST
nr:NADH dehydrogenase subunit 6 [Puncturella cf. parvinobilis]